MGSDVCIGDTGVRVRRTLCATCIFRPGNLMHLEPGRIEELVSEVEQSDGYIVCHVISTLDEDIPGSLTLDDAPREQAICRGSFDRYKTTMIQLAERLDRIEWVH